MSVDISYATFSRLCTYANPEAPLCTDSGAFYFSRT